MEKAITKAVMEAEAEAEAAHYERVEIGSGKAVGGVIGLLIAKDKFMCATILS